MFVVPSGRARGLSADAYAAVRLATGVATAWAVAAVAAVPLSTGDASGQPRTVVWAHVGELVAEEPKAWLCAAVAASVVAVGARLTWPVAVLWFAVGVVGLLPPVVAGHVSVGAWRDLATDAVVWHVPSAAVWVGALVALRGFLRRPDAAHRIGCCVATAD